MNKATATLFSITILLSLTSCGSYDRQQMDRLYAQGKQQMLQQSYSDAIITLTQSENYARKVKDNKKIGDICYEKAEINFLQGNCPEAEDQIEKANKYYLFSGTASLCKTAFLEAKISQQEREYKRSEILYQRSLSYYQQKKDTAKAAECLIGLAELQLAKEDGGRTVALMDEARQRYGYQPSVKELAGYAYAKALTGDVTAAEAIFDSLPPKRHFEYDQYLSDYLSLKGLHKEANAILKRLNADNDSSFRARLKTSSVKALEDYYSYEAEVEKIERRRDAGLWAMSVVTLALAVIAVIMMAKEKRRRQVEEFEEILEETDRKLIEGRSETDELRNKIARYYRSDFQMIASLYEKYLSNYSEKEGAKFAKTELLPLFQGIRHGAGAGSEFENLLNANMDGVMAKLRTGCPDMKENDFVFLSYLIAGFDTSLISKIMDMSKDNVRTRKSRLLKKIKSSSLGEDVLHLVAS